MLPLHFQPISLQVVFFGIVVYLPGDILVSLQLTLHKL